MKTLFTILTITLASLFATETNAQNTLTIQITNLEASKGKLMVALFNSKTDFMKNYANSKAIEVSGTTATIVFDNMPAGEYAITLYQDENLNGKLDLGEMWIPTEKYGFSNNVDPARIRRKPTFDECKFTIDKDLTITIQAIRALETTK